MNREWFMAQGWLMAQGSWLMAQGSWLMAKNKMAQGDMDLRGPEESDAMP